ncbi:protein KIAA0100-like [Tetranychus urticae]|uniref:protein KIAA0100-like n=1 Tax=Tetranychus urticae TaxID=32264 RepID=UPI00077BD3B0|nr:protein KIAA0100-like [Tetranychus urticae]
MYSLIDLYFHTNSLIIVSLIPIISWISIWLFLFALSWLLKTRYGSTLRINGIRFFQLNGISLVSPDGYKIEIDFVWLSLHLINSNSHALFGININGCRIEGRSNHSDIKETPKKDANIQNNSVNDETNFIKQLRWLRYLRFFSINVNDINLHQASINSKNSDVNCMLNMSVKGLNIFYYNKGSALILKCSAQKVDGQLDKSNRDALSTSDLNFVTGFCLDSQVELIFNEDKTNVNVHLSGLKINVHEYLVDIFAKNSSYKSPQEPKTTKNFLKSSYFLQHFNDITFACDDSILQLIRSESGHILTVKNDKSEFRIDKKSINDVNVEITVSGLSTFISDGSSDDPNSIASLAKFSFQAKIQEESSINQCIKITNHSEIISLHVNYNEMEFLKWIDLVYRFTSSSSYPPSSSKIFTQMTNPMNKPMNTKDDFLSKILRRESPRVKLSFETEFKDVSIEYNPACTSICLINSVRTGKITANIDPDPIRQELSFEFRLDNFSCLERTLSAQNSKTSSSPTVLTKDILVWQTCHFKLSHTLLSNSMVNCSIEDPIVDIDCFQCMLQRLTTAKEAFNQLKITNPNDTNMRENETNSTSSIFKSAIFSLKLNGLIAVAEKLKLCIKSSYLNIDTNRIVVALKNSEIYSLTPLVDSDAINSADIDQRQLYSSDFTFNLDHLNHERSFTFSDDVYLLWNVSFHINVVQSYQKIRSIWSLLKSSSSRATPSPPNSTKKNLITMTTIKLGDNVRIGALVSNQGQTVFLEFPLMSLTMPSGDRISFRADSPVSLVIDGHVIAKFEQLRFTRLPEVESSSLINRKDFGDSGKPLNLTRNNVCGISIESIKLVFPYKFNFAEIFNEKFVANMKWLRKYHSSSEPTRDEVKCDLVIKVKTITLEVGDDPFEVKLRDNYELMEDEYHESKKRIQMWREKIDESKKKNMSLTEAKLSELLAALSKKQENVYIERHRKLYATSPPRAHLFLVTVEDLELKIAADSSLTGYDKLVEIITRRLDRESPLPADTKFVTLWGRFVQGSIGSFCSRLRDFPKPLLDVKSLKVSGLLLGAEKEAGFRSKRECEIDIGPGLTPLIIERSMSPLKFYHDLQFDVEQIGYTHGACWEPVLQQISLCFESIIKPSVDPSPSLPWWDRLRLLFHGSLRVTSRNLSFFLHGSLNPYNSTEIIEVALASPKIECITGKIVVFGNLGLLVHTASKYDERKILNFPDVRITIDLMWECLGNPYDHHSVTPHAADKVPDYSIHQNWDSYRAFRSQYLKVQICIENLKVCQKQMPSITLYSSTLKWLENQKTIFRGIARLTRRGKLFGNIKPRKKPFSRIFKEIRLTVCLKKFKVYYWSSLSKQLGLEFLGGSLSHSAIHKISFIPYGDGLCRRPRPVSYGACMNSEVSDVEIWLCKNDSVKMTPSLEDIEDHHESRGTIRHFFVSFQTMSYNRVSSEATSPNEFNEDFNDPTHRLVIHGLKGAWTKQNRDIAVSLFDLYMNAEQLKRNLSTDALKGIRIDGQTGFCGGSPVKGKYLNQPQSSSPASTLNKNYAASMLQKLIADSESNPEGVFTDDVESDIVSEEPKLRGIAACSDENIIKKNWLIELVNSQVMLRGCETFGYMIVSASKTQIVQKLYTPVWKDRTLLSKTSLVGSIEGMQYYATVDARCSNDEDIDWLTVDNIEEKTCSAINEPPDLVGSGQSAGGVVSPVVGRSDILSSSPIQLQRIISRCSCQFYYVNYSKDVPSDIVDKAPPLPEDDDVLNLEPWDKEIAVDSFTMNHHDLEIYTNSQQFAMIMDLVNNLLLYVEPHRREAFENLQRMKFKSVLDPTESLRGPILVYQDNLRAMIARLKQVEKESYYLQKALLDEKTASGVENGSMTEELAVYERQIMALKEKINRTNEELTLMINLFKESQLTADKSRENSSVSQEGEANQELVSVARRIEICFKQACWKLTETDGQMGLAKVELNNFIYTKVVKSDDSFEHSLELGYIKVSNLIPNQKHPIVLEPAPAKPHIPIDSRRALRVYCRESPPQNGIPIKEHFEVNVIPLNLVVTYKFYKCLENFFFNQDDNRTIEPSYSVVSVGAVGQTGSAVVSVSGKSKGADSISITGTGKRRAKQPKSLSNGSNSLPSSSTTSSTLSLAKPLVPDDVEKMRQRAQRNKTFAYIKITEVPLRVSYKDKNIGNIQDFKFILPTIEYHNQTWEWLDLINAIKRESKHRLLSQALKQKLWITPTFSSITNNHQVEDSKLEDSKPPKEEEERKAKLLLGEIAVPSNKSSERTFKGLSIFTHRKDSHRK